MLRARRRAEDEAERRVGAFTEEWSRWPGLNWRPSLYEGELRSLAKSLELLESALKNRKNEINVPHLLAECFQSFANLYIRSCYAYATRANAAASPLDETSQDGGRPMPPA